MEVAKAKVGCTASSRSCGRTRPCTCWSCTTRSGGEIGPDPLSAEQCPRSVGDEVGALLWHPVAAALGDLEGQVSPMGLDLLEHRHRNVEVMSAEQQLRRSLEPLPL